MQNTFMLLILLKRKKKMKVMPYELNYGNGNQKIKKRSLRIALGLYLNSKRKI